MEAHRRSRKALEYQTTHLMLSGVATDLHVCTTFERSKLLLIPALLGANLGESTGPTTQHPYAHWMNGSHYHHEH